MGISPIGASQLDSNSRPQNIYLTLLLAVNYINDHQEEQESVFSVPILTLPNTFSLAVKIVRKNQEHLKHQINFECRLTSISCYKNMTFVKYNQVSLLQMEFSYFIYPKLRPNSLLCASQLTLQFFSLQDFSLQKCL